MPICAVHPSANKHALSRPPRVQQLRCAPTPPKQSFGGDTGFSVCLPQLVWGSGCDAQRLHPRGQHQVWELPGEQTRVVSLYKFTRVADAECVAIGADEDGVALIRVEQRGDLGGKGL